MEKIYSDGSIEDTILAKLKNGELIADGSLADGAVFHNFTSCRENLLNWYPFSNTGNLLEIGAGMGALTGLFCRSCKKVTALEQSEKRADIIRLRYKEYDNLEVVTADIFTTKFSEKYDYIILAGVLEYAAMNGDKNAYTKLLQRINELLKPNGKLLLAIENRFGLKYWCGAAEDHTSIPFDGISGYEENGFTMRYRAAGVRTFSKRELKAMLLETGFQEMRWYYPLPDYKFPNAVFSDEKLPTEKDIAAVKWTYPAESELIADERKLYKEILKNECFPFFSNSFLIEAGKNLLDSYHIKYASEKRDYADNFRIITFLDSQNRFIKKAASDNAQKHLFEMQRYLDDIKKSGVSVVDSVMENDTLVSPIENAVSADEQFKKYLRNSEFSDIVHMVEVLKQNLLQTSELNLNCFEQNNIEKVLSLPAGKYAMGPILAKGYIDMNFNNCFWKNGQLIFFDQEWMVENIPVNYILYRAVKYAYITSEIALSQIVNYLGINENERNIYEEYEKRLLAGMMDEERCRIFDPKMYNEGLKAIPRAKRVIYEQDIRYNELNREMSEKLADCQSEYEEKLRREEIELDKVKTEFLNEQARLLQEIKNKEGHIQLLLPPEREYKKIINSKMFKIMRCICRTFDIIMIIPRFLGRNFFAFCRMMTHVNRQELKIAYGYVKNEGLIGAYRHLMKDYHQGELRQIHIETEDKVYDEIREIQSCERIKLPVYEKPQISIIIPAYNQFTYTYYCIKSIAENSGDVPYEVILADDCSNDLTTQISSVVENLIIARTKQNLLFLRNCNQAAKCAKGDYILFLNNDTQVQKDWLRPLIDLCENDNTIGLTGSKLVYADGTLQEAGGIIWKDGSGWNYGRNDNAMKPEYNYVRDVDYISGAAIMIRKSLWDTLGGFDERFAPAYCEDSDLAFMVRKAGYRVVYQPASVVVHYEGKSNGTDLNSGIKKYQIENSIKLKEKWKEEFSKQYENAQCVFKARERSRDKKVILVIDHYVPQFDKDAGSKTTFQYLKMFVKKGYSVKFIGDNFYQDEPYTSVLQQMGIEVLYGPWYAEHWKEWILENKNYIDFAYLNRPHITIKYIDFLKENTNIKCIYYGHDLHFLRLRREYELTGNTDKLKESKEWMEKELYIMRKADISYYPSCVEEEEIHKIDPDIRVKAITAYVYETFLTKIEKDFSKREGIVFVGGFGHPPNEDAVIWFVQEIYPLIQKKLDIPFYIVGSKPTDAVRKLAFERIIVKGFVSEEELSRMYRECKLVVVPLRYGAGVKGKVVEALYYGTPMVTTPVGTEGIQGVQDIIEVAEKPEDFAKAVVDLYEDNERLAKTVDAYQDYVKNHFSTEAVWKVVEEDFA